MSVDITVTEKLENADFVQYSALHDLLPWTEPLDCTMDIETQPSPAFSEANCLYANIYTPFLPDTDTATEASVKDLLRPVMVFIPGENGTLNIRDELEQYGPQYFMTEGIVLIVVSYRSGFLGFAKVQDANLKPKVPGYAGFGDLTNFFNWLAVEIWHFGGSPDNITAVGHGSGASLILDALYSPEGFFGVTKVILQSLHGYTWLGPDQWNIKDYAVFAGLANAGQTEEQVLETIKRAPVRRLLLHEQAYMNKSKFRTVSFQFLTRFQKFNEHFRGKDAAVMIGFNSCEGIMDKIQCPQIDDDLGNIHRLLKNVVMPDGSPVQSAVKPQVANAITEYFYGNEAASRSKYMEIVSDLNHNIEILMTAKALPRMTARGTQVWLYRFDVDGQRNLVKSRHGVNDFPGACFGDELGYLFKIPGFPRVLRGSIEALTIRRMVKLWTNLARWKNPNPDPSCSVLGNTGWQNLANDEGDVARFCCLNIGQTLTYEANQPELFRLCFWYNLWKPSIKQIGEVVPQME